MRQVTKATVDAADVPAVTAFGATTGFGPDDA
jgi:hypothetical protein